MCEEKQKKIASECEPLSFKSHNGLQPRPEDWTLGLYGNSATVWRVSPKKAFCHKGSSTQEVARKSYFDKLGSSDEKSV